MLLTSKLSGMNALRSSCFYLVRFSLEHAAHRSYRITRRLKEMGWAEDIELLDQQGIHKMANLPVVRQSSKLTPKGT